MAMWADGVGCFCFTMKSVTVQLVDRVGLLGSGLLFGAFVAIDGCCLTGLVGTYDDDDDDDRDDTRGLTSGGIEDDI